MKEILLSVLVFLTTGTFNCLNVDVNDYCGGCRKLTPFIKTGKASEARALSRVAPGQFLGLESYAGFITVKEEFDSNLFFWFFPAKNGGLITPWITWLQGGPGYSSLYGLFKLVGPLEIVNGEVKHRSTTLNLNCSVLYLDNPVGAGFSFTKHDIGYPDNEDDVGAQMLEFLKQFLKMFPELLSSPLFLAGESYAGKYVPALGIKIHIHNAKTSITMETGKKPPQRRRREQYHNDTKSEKLYTTPDRSLERYINLRGLIVGGGMINPGLMMKYSDLMSMLGFMDKKETDMLRHIEESTVQLLNEGRMVDAANKFNETIEFIKKRSLVNVYNFMQDPTPNPKATDFESFIQREDIRHAMGTGNVTFNLNNQKVYQKMLPDLMNSTQLFVEELLNHYPVLCYHGQHDIIMAYSLAMNTYMSLRWNRWEEYHNATRNYMKDSNGNTLAYVKSGGGFTEMLVRHAGHMLPADLPALATSIHYDFIDKNK